MNLSEAHRSIRRSLRSRQALWDRVTAALVAVLALVVLALVVMAVRSTP